MGRVAPESAPHCGALAESPLSALLSLLSACMAGLFGGGGGGGFELLDFKLGVPELLFAGFEEGGGLFVLGEKLGEGRVAVFHGFDDGFELGDGFLEGWLLLGFLLHLRWRFTGAGEGFNDL